MIKSLSKTGAIAIVTATAALVAATFISSSPASAQQAPVVLPPSTIQCSTGTPWTVLDIGTGLSSLDDLTDPTSNFENRRNHSFNGLSTNNNLGTSQDTGISIPVNFAGDGIFYVEEFVSWDAYNSRPLSPVSQQTNEQWLVEVVDGNNNVFQTQFTPDLEDSVVNAEQSGSFASAFPVENGVASVVLRHYHDFPANGPATFSTVVPAAFCYRFVEEEPSLVCEQLDAVLISDRTYEFTVTPGVSGGVDINQLQYEFDLGDGNVVNTTDTVIQHTYADDGTYTITAAITTGQFELRAECTTEITINTEVTGQVLGTSTTAPAVLAETGSEAILAPIVGVALILASWLTLGDRASKVLEFVKRSK